MISIKNLHIRDTKKPPTISDLPIMMMMMMMMVVVVVVEILL